jgi:hypothetical protein
LLKKKTNKNIYFLKETNATDARNKRLNLSFPYVPPPQTFVNVSVKFRQKSPSWATQHNLLVALRSGNGQEKRFPVKNTREEDTAYHFAYA